MVLNTVGELGKIEMTRLCDFNFATWDVLKLKLLRPLNKLSLIDSTGQKTAIHDQQMSGNETGGIRRQEYCRAHQLFRFAKPSHWRSHSKFFAARRAIKQRRVEISAKQSRRDGIYADAMLRPFDGQRLGQRGHSGLAGGIRGNFVERHERGERSDVDDSPVFLFDHVRGKDLAGQN